MPLRKDENYRGPHALHVKSHRKLGKHRTVTEDAFELASWLVDDERVTLIGFGRVVSATSRKFKRRVECNVKDRTVHVMLVARNSAQSMKVKTRSVEDANAIAAEIKRQWMKGRISLVETEK